MAKYTIIQTWYTYGSVTQVVEQEKVRSICENAMKYEKLKEAYKANKGINDKDIYFSIEVINNDTGEIREYWNNKEDKILF